MPINNLQMLLINTINILEYFLLVFHEYVYLPIYLNVCVLLYNILMQERKKFFFPFFNVNFNSH